MPESTNGANDATRLDRVERIIEVLANTHVDMQQDIKIVLRAQVLMSDALEKLTHRVAELAEAQQRTEESLRHTDRRMDALILTVDEIIRGRKQP